MTDILRIALDRRAELHDEVTRIEDFIRMADSLLHRIQPLPDPVEVLREQPAPAPQAGPVREIGPGLMRMNLLRRGPAAAFG